MDDPAPSGDTTATVERLAAPPTSVEVGTLNSMDPTFGTAVEADSWPTSPPKGDSEMNVGVEPSEDAVEMVEAPRLPNRTLTFDAMVAVKEGIPTSVVLCRPAAEVGEASTPVNTAVALFSYPEGTPEDEPNTAVTLFSMDPYPGGTPEDGPLGYGNLVT